MTATPTAAGTTSAVALGAPVSVPGGGDLEDALEDTLEDGAAHVEDAFDDDVDAAGLAAAFPNEAAVLRLVNAARDRAGAPPLRANIRLHRAARAHAAFMRESGEFSHRNWARYIRRAGYRNQSGELGENIAFGQGGPREVFDDWMASPAHRRNILNPAFRDMGLNKDGRYWAQMFGGR